MSFLQPFTSSHLSKFLRVSLCHSLSLPSVAPPPPSLSLSLTHTFSHDCRLSIYLSLSLIVFSLRFSHCPSLPLSHVLPLPLSQPLSPSLFLSLSDSIRSVALLLRCLLCIAISKHPFSPPLTCPHIHSLFRPPELLFISRFRLTTTTTPLSHISSLSLSFYHFCHQAPGIQVVCVFYCPQTRGNFLSSSFGINSQDHRIRSIQNDQQAIRDSSVIFVAPYWSYRISCLKVQLAPLTQGADSEK